MKTHPKQNTLHKQIQIGDPIYIYGPTGSGKTSGVAIAAQENKLHFYKKLIGAQMTESSILGYMDATGKYVPGIAYKPFVEGGILLLDEIDNGNSNTNLVVNGLADREINFPCGMAKAHEDFRLIVTANTIGSGANLHYVGRNRQDIALTSRFVYLKWDYDLEFEKSIVFDTFNNYREKFQTKLKISDDYFWALYDDFLRCRDAANEMQLNHVLSPRNAIYLAKQVAAGIDKGVIFEGIIRRGIDKETATQLITKAKSQTSRIFDPAGNLINQKQVSPDAIDKLMKETDKKIKGKKANYEAFEEDRIEDEN